MSAANNKPTPLETGLIGGIEKRRIEIVDYRENWPNKFEKHAKTIAGSIGPVSNGVGLLFAADMIRTFIKLMD